MRVLSDEPSPPMRWSLPPRLLPTDTARVSDEDVERIIAPGQMVTAAAGVVLQGEGVAIEDVGGRTGATDQRVVAATAVTIHGAGVADEAVLERAIARDQLVVAAAGVVVIS